ncbi:type II toxin-antitoxin system VapC family toxin [Neorhizobium sp. DT-125]|uniref:type II toxin-antitoxin system VapC family toxin n=1 Tax=Neorhizobium sp. DT-125 TaxID=3396163 RepID=UPI003F1CD718
MFVDACAIVSMMAGERTAETYEQALAGADAPFTSPLAAWEAIIVLSRPDQLDCRYSEAEGAVVEWLDARRIDIREAGSPREVLRYAVAAAERHGIGRRYLSNFDCFHYAYAKIARQPLLTLDQLLQQTDAETLP